MLGGFVFGIIVCVVGYRLMNPCPHDKTEYVSKCLGCGKVFNDGLSEMRRR